MVVILPEAFGLHAGGSRVMKDEGFARWNAFDALIDWNAGSFGNGFPDGKAPGRGHLLVE